MSQRKKMEMNMEPVLDKNKHYTNKIKKVPWGFASTPTSYTRLLSYFEAISLDDLLVTLYELTKNGYIEYSVKLSSGYLDWEEAHIKAVHDTTPLLPPPGIFGLKRRQFQLLTISDDDIMSSTPLTPKQLSELLRVFPSKMLERYLQFTVKPIDRKKISEIIAAHSTSNKVRQKIDNYYVDDCNELIVGVADVTYKGKVIVMRRQQRELLRLLVKNHGITASWEKIYDDSNIFRTGRRHPNPHATVDKLVNSLLVILRQAIGECIINNPSEGWRLDFS